jgi:hypothetical protein
MYRLYVSKSERVLKVEPIGNLMIDTSKITDEPSWFNDCYMVCNDRKILKEKAIEIKNEWIQKAKEELECMESLEIKSRY